MAHTLSRRRLNAIINVALPQIELSLTMLNRFIQARQRVLNKF